MDSCEADGLARALHLLLQHALHDVVAAQRDREAAALVVLAVRVHRRPSYPRAPVRAGGGVGVSRMLGGAARELHGTEALSGGLRGVRDALGVEAVSYTHLTLPTICSV